jgi:hypothetical protein
MQVKWVKLSLYIVILRYVYRQYEKQIMQQ